MKISFIKTPAKPEMKAQPVMQEPAEAETPTEALPVAQAVAEPEAHTHAAPEGLAEADNESSEMARERYAAFKLTKSTVRELSLLKVCPLQQAWRWLAYGQLLQVIDNGLEETQFVLEFPVAVVFVRGRRLRIILRAIEERTCELIQAYDAARWEKPMGDRMTFIEQIEIFDPRIDDVRVQLANFSASKL